MNRFANKSKFSPFYALLQLPGISVNSVHIDISGIEINAQIKGKYSVCPVCGKKSHLVHSTYCRSLQDLSVFSKPVSIKLLVKKYKCTNDQCKRKIFSQQLSSVFDRYSRRTQRANKQITQMSLEMSARKSSWISNLQGLPVSPSTCLRLTSKCDIPIENHVRHLGIDDWAYRKGHTYGTIIVDRETGKAIDLIRSREKEDIINWLKSHPHIESVTRDRAECYSRSISLALPNAVQIADRFHLAVNYSDYVIRITKKLVPQLKKIKQKDTTLQYKTRDPGIQKIIDLGCSGTCVLNEQRKNLILKAKELYEKGYSKCMVAKILNLNFRTVHKYIDNDLNQINTGANPRIDYSSYLEDLITSYSQGEKLSVVYRKMKNKGFQGSQRGLNARFGTIYKEGKLINSKVTLGNMKREYLPQTVSSRKLAIYLTNKNYEKILSHAEIETFDTFRDNNPILKELWNISVKFRGVFENKSVLLLQEWIDLVMNSSFQSLKCFVKGIIKDWEAIKAAILTVDNNGITEGNVNRLKNIKRQMYGRAGFELLRRKVVLSNTG